MIALRLVALLMAILAGVLGVSCGPRRVRTSAPQPRGEDLIVLMPDADSKTTGRVTVSNPAGGVELAAARESTRVAANQPPSPVQVISESEVERLFASALAALPPAPRHFTLFFQFDSDELTNESRSLVPEILTAVKGRPAPDVFVVGHTDTTGSARLNFELGMRRANMVRNLLVQAGLDASFVEVTSHGETDLLIATANNIPEPRNRRVEITVR